MSEQPNVLFILSDQHNAKVLGHKGHPDVVTPNLDRLVTEGVRFENAITQNPICTPSRLSWLSGQYCHNHGYYGLSGPNPGGMPNLLGHFRRAGYTTGAIGKIHCPEYWIEDDCDYFRETFANCSIGGNPEYAAYLESHVEHPELDPYALNLGMDGCPSPIPYRHTREGWVASESIHFMQRAVDQGQPFILHASLPYPHSPYAPAQEFWDLYDHESLTLPPNADYEMIHKAPHLRRTLAHWKEGPSARFEPRDYRAVRRRKLHGYLGNVSQVDYAVGEMLDWLRESGLDGNTIVVYSSDHGDYACEHGLLEKAPGICSDAITRIPCIWRWPGHFPAGHVADEIVETVDLANTMCALAGLNLMETVDGVDISHLLAGKSGAVHKVGITEFAWSKSVRKGDYRYVYYPPQMFRDEYPGGFGELYDIRSDPWEMTNLYFDRAYANLVREMQVDLLDWLITTTRPKTVHPLYRTDTRQGITRYGATVNHDGKLNPERIRKAIESPRAVHDTNYL